MKAVAGEGDKRKVTKNSIITREVMCSRKPPLPDWDISQPPGPLLTKPGSPTPTTTQVSPICIFSVAMGSACAFAGIIPVSPLRLGGFPALSKTYISVSDQY